MTTAELAGLTFHGTEVPTGLHFRRIQGWEGLPESKNRVEQRPQAHGAFDSGEDFREGAAVSIDGWYRARTRLEALVMRRELSGELALSDQRITVTDELGPTSRDVSVRGVKLGDLFGSRFDFTIDLYAEDPRRYGPTVSVTTGVPASGGGRTWPAVWPVTWTGGGSSGRVTVVNDGYAETFSTFEVTGGLAGGFSITEVGTGREILYEQDVPLDSTIYIDTRTGAVYLDAPGNDKSGQLSRSDWTPVPRRGQSVLQFVPIGAVTGTPTLTARTAPAYW